MEINSNLFFQGVIKALFLRGGTWPGGFVD